MPDEHFHSIPAHVHFFFLKKKGAGIDVYIYVQMHIYVLFCRQINARRVASTTILFPHMYTTFFLKKKVRG